MKVQNAGVRSITITVLVVCAILLTVILTRSKKVHSVMTEGLGEVNALAQPVTQGNWYVGEYRREGPRNVPWLHYLHAEITAYRPGHFDWEEWSANGITGEREVTYYRWDRATPYGTWTWNHVLPNGTTIRYHGRWSMQAISPNHFVGRVEKCHIDQEDSDPPCDEWSGKQLVREVKDFLPDS